MPTPLHDLAASLVRVDREFRLTVKALLQRLDTAEQEAVRLAVRCRRLEDELSRRGLSESEISTVAGDLKEEAWRSA